MSKPIYKLYKQNRCYGNQTQASTVEKVFVIQSNNMNDLMSFINKEGDVNKSYIILKYIDDKLMWRQLLRWHFHKNKNFDKICKGDLTTTWTRLFYDTKLKTWKETNYRYDNEIVM